ncbi:MAG TPA: hypothetical protein PKA06_04155, partial [Gemmatales bacterium]|nr:hypothetical protein [Gemmatales bacterium]
MKYLMHWSLAGLLFSTPASFGDMPLKGRPTPTGHTTTWMQAPATTSTVSATPSHQPVVPSAPPMESPRVIVREGPSRGETV